MQKDDRLCVTFSIACSSVSCNSSDWDLISSFRLNGLCFQRKAGNQTVLLLRLLQIKPPRRMECQVCEIRSPIRRQTGEMMQDAGRSAGKQIHSRDIMREQAGKQSVATVLPFDGRKSFSCHL